MIEPWLEPLRWVYVACLSAFVMPACTWLANALLEVGKWIVVGTTLTWWLGIVATNSDFDFTATNVVVHGAPYAYLLCNYANQCAFYASSWLRSSPRPVCSRA